MTSRTLRRVLRLTGHRTTPVGDLGVLLSPASRGAVRVRRMARRTWLVGTGAAVQTLAPGVRLVHEPRALRSRMHGVQNKTSRFLALQQLLWLLREHEVGCVLDVGANTGQFATRLRRAGYRGRIESFEPVPHTAAELRKRAADDPLWRVHELALGDEDGSAIINVMPGTLSSLREPSDYGRDWSSKMKATSPQEIQVRRLDGLWDEVVGPDAGPVFLKLDTQGFDLPAFRGSGDRAEELVGLQSEAALLTLYEGAPRLPQMLEEYERRGFTTAGIFPISRESGTLRVIEVDLLMVRDRASHGRTSP